MPKALAKSIDETRQRLMVAAGEVFAEQGFKAATIRDICKRARANVAAVNYHFRDKAELYQEVLRQAHCAAKPYFPEELQQTHLPAKERLALFIHSFLKGLLSSGRPAWHGKLMAREMIDPSEALDTVVEGSIRPYAKILGKILSEALGTATTDPLTWHVAYSIIGQCLFYKNCKPVISRLQPELTYNEATIDLLSRHVAAFSWAGIEALRITSYRNKQERA